MNTIPCQNCPVLAMCRSKSMNGIGYSKLLDSCKPLQKSMYHRKTGNSYMREDRSPSFINKIIILEKLMKPRVWRWDKQFRNIVGGYR